MKKLLLIVLGIFLLILGSCKDEQIENSIDYCNDNQDCFDLKDDAITEELENRGIQDGVMTNLEMESLFSILSMYYIAENDFDFNIAIANELNMFFMVIKGFIQADYSSDLDRITGLENSYERYKYLNLEQINTEMKQYIFADDIQIVIYKQSSNTYVYEVTASSIYTYTINTDVSKVYFEDKELDKIDISVFDDLMNGEYNELISNGTIKTSFEYYVIQDGIKIVIERNSVRQRTFSITDLSDGGYTAISFHRNEDFFGCLLIDSNSSHLLEFDLTDATILEVLQDIENGDVTCVENMCGNYSEWITNYKTLYESYFGDYVIDFSLE